MPLVKWSSGPATIAKVSVAVRPAVGAPEVTVAVYVPATWPQKLRAAVGLAGLAPRAPGPVAVIVLFAGTKPAATLPAQSEPEPDAVHVV